MASVNIHDAKTHLSRLLTRVAEGETVVIARAGKPVAKLVKHQVDGASGSRRLGFLRGVVQVPEDFDTMGQEALEEAFFGGDDT